MSVPIRIGIDGRVLVGKLSGIGRYVFEVCRELDAQMPEAEFFVYGHDEMARPADNNRWHYRVEPLRIAKKLKPTLWVKLRAGIMARSDRLDVFWGCGHFLPLFLNKAVKTVLTVYDLVYQLYPETMTMPHLVAHRLFFLSDCRRASQLVAISDGTSRRMVAGVGRRADAIVRPGISRSIGRRSEAEIVITLRKLEISEKFLLAVSTIEPRKNYGSLVRAFVALRSAGLLRGYQLIIVGGGGWKSEGDVASIKAAYVHGVRWLGFVSDDVLSCLYSATGLYVCPSLYEGFGIPALEAIACGAKALLADTPELREVGGDSADYTNVDEDALKDSILRAAERTESLFEKGRSDSLPTWHQGAITMRGVFHSVVAGRH